MRELDGKTAVVTGAGRGIGRAVALELARAGATVVLVARDAEGLEAVRARVADEGGAAVALPADVADRGWLARLDAAAPAVDAVVHGAAHFPRYGRLERVDPGDAARATDVAVRAALDLARHVLSGMRARRFGRFVFLGSMTAARGAAGQAPYAAAKAALRGLARSLAAEAGRDGVTANVLALGLVDTERTRAAVADEARAELLRRTPVGRAGTPEEVARAVRFLVSPRSAYLTGSELALSGGLGLDAAGTGAPA